MKGKTMKVSHIITTALVCSALVGGITACGVSDQEKQSVVQEVAKRGFGNPTLAPDVSEDRTFFVYATYGGCRIRLGVLDGKIGYPGVSDDVSTALLDFNPAFAPCRSAASGAQPQR